MEMVVTINVTIDGDEGAEEETEDDGCDDNEHYNDVDVFFHEQTF